MHMEYKGKHYNWISPMRGERELHEVTTGGVCRRLIILIRAVLLMVMAQHSLTVKFVARHVIQYKYFVIIENLTSEQMH